MELPATIRDEIWQRAEHEFIADFFAKKVEVYLADIPPCAPIAVLQARIIHHVPAVCRIFFRLAECTMPTGKKALKPD